MALHDEPDHLLCRCGCIDCNGGAPRQSPHAALSPRSPIQNHIALRMMPAASGYSLAATSRLQSWDGGTPDFHLLQLSPCRYVTENHFAMGACCTYSG